jgi:hypothetical protein
VLLDYNLNNGFELMFFNLQKIQKYTCYVFIRSTECKDPCFEIPLSINRSWGFLEKYPVPGLGQEKYTMTLEHHLCQEFGCVFKA